MKFVFGDIVSFIPVYSERDAYVGICQVVEYDEKKKMYLVIAFDGYCFGSVDDGYLTEVKEKDIESIKNTVIGDSFAYNQILFDKSLDFSKMKKLNVYELDADLIDFVANRKLYVDYIDYLRKHGREL